MSKEQQYFEMLLKIKKVYENGDENELDELLYGMFTNEIYNDDY